MQHAHSFGPKIKEDWGLPERYEIREHLGSGSYGFVRAAWDNQTNRMVAIKRITHLFDDLTDCKRVLREVCILLRVDHELIVKVLDIIVPKDINNFGELCLVFEYVPSDLKKLVRNSVWLTEMHVKTIMYNMLMAMKYVHSNGVYHRDLKPANCLVNEDCIVKICDFGLARCVNEGDMPHERDEDMEDQFEDQDDEKDTFYGKDKLTSHVVTRWYRAPEVILLNETYTCAIDVWSMGCIFGELLQMIKGNVHSCRDRQPVFPGGSCFPLSPDRRRSNDFKFHATGGTDQLSVIFNIIGSPEEEDLECLEREDAKRYLAYFPKIQKQDWKNMFPVASDDCIDILKGMLLFNPERRLSVNECLEHPFFRNLRVPQLERASETKIKLPFEDHVDTVLETHDLRRLYLDEIAKFRPEEVYEKRKQAGLI